MESNFNDMPDEGGPPKRKVVKLTYVPDMTADEIVTSTFTDKERTRTAVDQLFPMLHLSVEKQRQHNYQKSSGRLPNMKPIKPSVPDVKPPFYPDMVGAPPTLLTSPRAEERISARNSVMSKARMDTRVDTTALNLRPVFDILSIHMDEQGELTAAQFRSAMIELGLGRLKLLEPSNEDPETDPINRLFSIFNVHRRDKLRATEIVMACESIVNGTHQKSVRKVCFDLFDHDGRGCIHKSHLDELKVAKFDTERNELRAPAMVKVLMDLFTIELQLEEERYVAKEFKGKGKKKKKVPPLKPMQKSIIPVGRMRVSHIDFETFDKYFTEHREVAATFAPAWLSRVIADPAVRVLAVQAALEGSRLALESAETEDE